MQQKKRDKEHYLIAWKVCPAHTHATSRMRYSFLVQNIKNGTFTTTKNMFQDRKHIWGHTKKGIQHKILSIS